METVNCAICRQNNTEIIFKKGNLDKDLDNVICKNCGLVFLNPRSDREDYEVYHKKDFLSEKNIRAAEQVAQKMQKRDIDLKYTIFNFCRAFLKSGQNIADIGAGFGTLIDIIKKETAINAVGIELGDLDVEIAKKYYNLDLIKESLEAFSKEDGNRGKFDIVILHHTFEHLPEPSASLEQIKKILKPDGLLYIGAPNVMNIKKRPDIFFQIAHPFSYSPHSLKKILNKFGFGIIKFNEKAGYPGGMEIIAAIGKENAGDVGMEKGRDYRTVINYVQKTDKKFRALRKARETFLFWLPANLKIKISRIIYLFLKKEKITAKLKDFYKNHRLEFFIYFAALAAQLIYFLIVIFKFGAGAEAFQAINKNDTDEYIKLGTNLFYHLKYSVIKYGDAFWPEPVRPPLYPLFIAGFYALSRQFWFVILAQNLLLAFAPVLAYKIGAAVFGRKIGLIGAALFILESERVAMANTFLSDGFFSLLFLASVYFYLKMEKNIGVSHKYTILSALFLGLATLARPIGIIVLGPYFLITLGRAFFDRLWKKRIFIVAFFTLVYAACLLPWMIRNQVVFGQLKLSLSGSYTYFLENIPYYYEYKLSQRGGASEAFGMGRKMIEQFRKDQHLSPDIHPGVLIRREMRSFEYEDYYAKKFFEVLLGDPFGYLRIHLWRLLPFFSDTALTTIAINIFNFPGRFGFPYLFYASRLPWILMEIIIVIGFVLQIIRRQIKADDWPVILFLIFILGFGLVSSMNTATSRLRQPINPFIFILFAYYLFWFLGQKRALKKN